MLRIKKLLSHPLATKLLILWILSVASIVIFFNGCTFSKKTAQKMLVESMSKSYDIIIVPGIPFYDIRKWDDTMKGRIYWSKFLYDKGITKNIMYSGSSVYSPYYEAEIMAMYAEALGIPKEHIFIEKKAEHSTENVYYSYHLAKKLGFNKIAIASDRFQTKNLQRFARERLSPDVGIIPIVDDSLEAMESKMIDPQIDFKKAYNKDFISITERESFFKRLRGTMGRNLDTSAYK